MTQTTSERPAGSLDDQLTARLLHQRIIVLGQEVEDGIANRLCAELLLLSAEDPHRDISLYINSPGGSVSAGLAIYDTMRLIPNDVSTLAMGLAASMGQFLLCRPARPASGTRCRTRGCCMHQGSAGIGGTAIDIEIQAENLEHTKGVMLGLIAEHTGQPFEKIEKDSLRDRWFTAEEAVDYGFVDQVLSDVTDVTPARPAGQLRAPVTTMSQYTIPSVVEKTIRGERAVDIYSRLLSDRIIYLGTEIDDGVANVVIAQLLHLEADSPDTPISLYLNSPGGSVTATLAIYDTMQFIRSSVGTTCVGQAASGPRCCSRPGSPGTAPCSRARGSSCTSPPGAARGRCPTWPSRPRRSSGCAPRWSRSCPSTPGRPWSGCAGHRARPDLQRRGGGGLRSRRRRARQPQAGGRHPSAWVLGSEADRPGDPAQGPGDTGGQVDQAEAEGAGDRAEHLRAGLLEPTLDLGQVLDGDPGLLGDVGEGAVRVAVAPSGARGRPPRARTARARCARAGAGPGMRRRHP